MSEEEDDSVARPNASSVEAYSRQFGRHPGTPTQNLQITGGNFGSAGRDMYNHTHIHEAPKADIMTYFEPIDNFRQIQQDTLAKATPKTGEWLFSDEIFPAWRLPGGSVKTLWGSGIPGAGKTILTSIAINGVQEWASKTATPICIGFIYIRYSDNAGLSVRHCLEVLVKQTIEKHLDCLHFAEKAYADHIRLKTRPSEAELLQLLRSFTDMTGSTFYFLDALDEAPTKIQFDLLDKLSSLPVKLFITSRPLRILEAEFPDSHRFTIAARDADLELHIAKEIQRSPHLRHLLDKAGASWRARIISSVKEKCAGMFLHASLQMAALQDCSSVYDVKETLEGFPAQIEEVYLHTWKRIIDQPSKSGLLAQTCISWVLHATRSMTIEELQHAVATDPISHKFEPTRLVDSDTLFAPCRGLLVIEEESRLVRLVHYTAKDPLQQLVLKTFPHPHSLLTSTSIASLIDHGFQDWQDSYPFSLHNTLESEPFVRYAYDSWFFHALRSLDDISTTSLVTKFIKGCRAFPVPKGPVSFDLVGPLPLVASLNLPIALAGFDGTVQHDPNLRTSSGDTALHIASFRDSPKTMKELLELPNIMVNATNDAGKTPLLLAVQFGNEVIIELLANRPDLAINFINTQTGESALTLASSHDRASIVQLLLTHPKTNINGTDAENQSALLWASRQGNTAIVEILIAYPQIDVNLADKDARTPLIWASLNGHTRVVELLLSHYQVDVNLADKDGLAPLLAASKSDQSSLVWAFVGFDPTAAQRLLAHPEINVNARDKEGRSSLITAAKHGHIELLESLLNHSHIDANSLDNDGRTALSWAVTEGHTSAVQILLSHSKVNVNLADKKGSTPLLWASKVYEDRSLWTWVAWQIPTFELLLEDSRVDVNAADCEGETVLISAAKADQTKLILLLLAHPQMQVNRTDNLGRSALLWASHNGLKDTVDLLVSHPQVNVNQEDEEGRSPLIWAIIKSGLPESGLWGFFKKDTPLEVLLAHSLIDLNVADKRGETALIYASKKGDASSVKKLLAHGAIKVRSPDNSGRTALDWALERGHTEVIELLRLHSESNPEGTLGPSPFLSPTASPNITLLKEPLPKPLIKMDIPPQSASPPPLNPTPDADENRGSRSNSREEKTPIRSSQSPKGDEGPVAISGQGDSIHHSRRRRLLAKASKAVRGVWFK